MHVAIISKVHSQLFVKNKLKKYNLGKTKVLHGLDWQFYMWPVYLPYILYSLSFLMKVIEWRTNRNTASDDVWDNRCIIHLFTQSGPTVDSDSKKNYCVCIGFDDIVITTGNTCIFIMTICCMWKKYAQIW